MKTHLGMKEYVLLVKTYMHLLIFFLFTSFKNVVLLNQLNQNKIQIFKLNIEQTQKPAPWEEKESLQIFEVSKIILTKTLHLHVFL